MIKEATFESYWDGGICVSSSCKVNMETKEVFEIEVVHNVDGLEVLDNESTKSPDENLQVVLCLLRCNDIRICKCDMPVSRKKVGVNQSS